MPTTFYIASLPFQDTPPNGGFAASADRPLMSEEEQRAKLRLAETVDRYYWGNEI